MSTTIHYITRDGAKVSPYFLREQDAVRWLLRHQGQSTHWATTHEGYAFATYTAAPWSEQEQARNRSTKSGVLRHDHGTIAGTSHERNLVRSNCGACVLDGYRDTDDDESPRDAPNYAGWARVYVEFGRTVPTGFLPGFMRDLNEDTPYGEALRRDVLTYGVQVQP